MFGAPEFQTQQPIGPSTTCLKPKPLYLTVNLSHSCRYIDQSHGMVWESLSEQHPFSKKNNALMKQELFIDPCSKFIHSVFVAVSTAEKRTREIGNKNCSTVFPKKTSKKNIATKNPSYGRTCIKNVKALCNCLGALSVKLGTSCFCLFAFFSSLQSSLSALLAICNCTSAFCDTCLSGRFFRFAVGHVHYVLRQCCRVVPCEVACDRAKASPGFTPARESHVFLLIPRHHLQPAIRFQSSVHLKQTTQSLVKDWGKVLHSLNLEPILEAQSVTKRRKAFSS